MAQLEEAGLITQPHTSAGRIPTNQGYRLFVDRIAQIKPLSQAERRAIENFISGAIDPEEIANRAVRLLAQITHQVAIIQVPDQDRVVLSGTANLARSHHESAAELSPILEALEEQVVLLKLLSDAGSSINVKIGAEQLSENLQSTQFGEHGGGFWCGRHSWTNANGLFRFDGSSSRRCTLHREVL
jgi:transcriptional regulator of heat shock response